MSWSVENKLGDTRLYEIHKQLAGPTIDVAKESLKKDQQSLPSFKRANRLLIHEFKSLIFRGFSKCPKFIIISVVTIATVCNHAFLSILVEED
jgi:hypothetical protein